MNTFRGSLGRSCAMSAALLAASAGRAQVIEWDNAAGGNWSAAANWSPMNVPDTAAETARFSLAGTYTVNQDGSFTIGAIDAANPNVTVIVNNGNNLQLATGTMMNNGLVIVNSGGGSASFILFNASGNISGSGRIVLSGNTGFNDTAYVNTAPNQTVTQGLGHTISGASDASMQPSSTTASSRRTSPAGPSNSCPSARPTTTSCAPSRAPRSIS